MIDRRRFTRLDVQRVVRGVIDAGLVPDEVVISAAGEICVRTKQSDGSASKQIKDELERHFGKTGK